MRVSYESVFFTGLREGVQGVYPIGYRLGFLGFKHLSGYYSCTCIFLSYSEGGISPGDVGKILPNLVNISWCSLVLLIVISVLLYFFFSSGYCSDEGDYFPQQC